jgi:hypothetical protein
MSEPNLFRVYLRLTRACWQQYVGGVLHAEYHMKYFIKGWPETPKNRSEALSSDRICQTPRLY